MIKYAALIQRLVKLSALKIDKFEVDKEDPSRINLLVQNNNTGDFVPFAQYKIEQAFIDFLSSDMSKGWNIPKLNDIIQYITNGSFRLVNDPDNHSAMQAAEKNMELAKSIGAEKIPEYLKNKKYVIPLNVIFKRQVLNANPHDTALSIFNHWLDREKQRAAQNSTKTNPQPAR